MNGEKISYVILSGIDIRVLVHEMKPIVEKAWIVNIYEIPGRIFIFKIRQPQVGTRFLLIEPGKRIHLTKFNREMPKSPTNFAKTLRDHLRNKMINNIEQQNMDRLVILNIGPEPSYKLVAELFGRGNLILVSPSKKIVTATSFRKMKDRDIHPGKDFKPLPTLDRDLLRDGVEGLQDLLEENPKTIPALNQWLGLGPHYSRYVLKELNIDKKKSDELTNEDVVMIKDFALRLRQRLLDHNYQPTVYLEPEEKVSDLSDLNYDDQWGDDALPFRPENVVKILPWSQSIVDVEELNVIEMDHFWEALDIFYSSQEYQELIEDESEELESQTEKLTNQLEEQEKHRERLLKMADIYRKYANALYANFQEANELIETVYDAKKNNVSWETITKKLVEGKKKGIKAAQLFEKVNPDEAKINLKLPYNQEIVDLSIDFRKSLTENADELYQDAKKAEKKAKGAREAIKRTHEKIEMVEKEVKKKVKTAQEQVVVLKRRKNWFEKFHWTITPDETLIIGGYDASSNERIVKRYMDTEDLFVHADLQGASAVVIKYPGHPVKSATRSIASQMAVCYSSGWKAKLTIADAFVVESEQVSLTPPSGEYLPKGSFMIYGEKQFEKNNPLEIAIGVVIERHWARIIAGPVQCVKNSDMYVILKPGENSRGSVAKQIQNIFLSSADDIAKKKIEALDISDIAWYIPGDAKISEKKL